jgi:hypothetical protein
MKKTLMLTWGARASCVCMCLRTIVCDNSSDDAKNTQQRHCAIPEIPATLCPRSCPRGSLQRSPPANDMCPFDEDKPISVSTVAGGVGISPLPVFTIGLLALLWVWVLDEAMLPARLRKRTSETAGRKGGCRCRCRCRVCTLRVQAQGQPLHDVRDVV